MVTTCNTVAVTGSWTDEMINEHEALSISRILLRQRTTSDGKLLKMYFSCPDLLFVDDRLIELKHNGFPSAILANTKKNEKIGSDWTCSQVDDKKKKALGVWCEHGELNEFQLTKWN